ncbi:helix-hairpin-helix domain-containing protein [Pedobacter polaris]|uniref:Helix-hairpin-helix domain-containing protein n=1 Tax=Pedobacter polaris TaxID=2571273 RepID=A0A4U1CSL4_9SPHI|nr:helix-hairpin-helix domain-containing protein [Pedobacter polaris]TKC10025.1 helix-hairpin-helix domain-containing protein [Pedobacter polaris]
MYFRILLTLLIISCIGTVRAQEDTFIKDLIESLTENLPEDYDLSELQDRLIFFKKHPINLNKTTAEELKSLIFLSPLQISNLFTHIKTNGKLIDVLELQSIADFDTETIQRLLPFVTLNQTDLVDKITLRNMRVLADNDLVIRFGRVIETQKGFTDLKGSRYLGSPERFLLRYKYNYSNRVSASLIFEKDAGENFIRGEKQFLLDYQSAHIAIFNTGRFKKIVAGDYTLQFGQGLTLWSGFSFGKAPDVTSVAKKDVGLKPYTSANEYSFFRGLATTVSLNKNIDLTIFSSYRKLDASLNLDNNGDEVLSTINETGLHRTATEIKNKTSINQQLFGGAIQYQKDNLSLGAVAYHTLYSNKFETGSQVYRNYNFTGKTITNVGLHYNYTYKNIYFFGEGAKNLKSGFAYLNGALISLSAKVSAVLLHRNYQKDYHNFFNQATAEASEAFNEKGFYAGLNITPIKYWSIAIYADYFKFPWLKFRIDAPSDGYEFLGQLTYTPTKTFKAFLRYKSELKQQNTDIEVPINYLDDVKKETYRGDVSWRLNKSLSFQNRVEVSQFKKGNVKAEFGYMIYQDVDYSPNLSKLSGNIRIAYFNTPSYNSRIYAYEDDVLYNFAFGMYSGNGFRTYVNIKYKLWKRLDIWARHALFLYRNVETVGSGLDEINGSKKNDVKIQIRYQF